MATYKLVSENLTGLSGPMGTERTWANWTRYFSDLRKAKKAAEEDYAKQAPGKTFSWKKDGKRHHSGDLLFVMYNIGPIVVE